MKGIIHWDLKLENILITNKNRLLIADFGLSSTLKNGKFFKSSRGTIWYADPEILRWRIYSGELADIWSCGIILYCLLCGDLPFEDDVFGILWKKVMKCDIFIPEYISKEAKNLIYGILNPSINNWFNI